MKTNITYILIGALLVILAGCGETAEKKETIRPVFYQALGTDRIQEKYSSSGITQAATEATLSFKVGGVLEHFALEMGDTVKSGAVLARLDDTDYSINVSKAEAGLRSAEAQYAAARSSFLRIEKLYVQNNASLNEYEKLKAQAASAETLVKTARAQYNAAKNQLDYTILRAPHTGLVTSVMVRENEMIGPGRPILTFAAFSALDVRTTVPESIIGRIRQGQEVSVSFSTFPGKTFHGIIAEMSPGTPNATSFPLIVRLTESAAGLLPGMTASVEIPLNTDTDLVSGIVIDADAVGHDQSGDFVFVAAESADSGLYIAEKRNIKLGALSPDGYEVLEGLDKDEMVITAGLSFLYDGRKVKLLNEEK